MKKFLFSIAALLMAFTANAQEMKVTLGDLVIEDGVGMLEISLDYPEIIAGWQMYIEAPEGLDPLDCELPSDRYPQTKLKKFYHSVTFTSTAEGTLVLCYSTEAKDGNNLISGTSGVIGTILFDAEKYTGKAEDAVITIKKFAVSLPDATQINYPEDITTGIEFITNANTFENGAIYNLKGQRVEKAGKGLYIVNGKKVVK